MTLKETIRPIQPKTDRDISINGNLVKPVELFRDLIQVSQEKGWDFDVGDPEFWKFSSRLIVPGGRALDLGSDFGRTSVPFALQGMEVTAYDTNANSIEVMNAIVEDFDLPELRISVHNEDIRCADFGKGAYDTVVIDQTFGHFESRKEAFEVLDKAIEALKPGGHIWFRGNGKGDPEDDTTEDFYMNPCKCSGEMRMEKHLFFDPTELVHNLSKKGISIKHIQMGEMLTIPKKPNEEAKKRPNIMYGEDWDPNREYFDEGVTIDDLFGESVQKHHRTDDVITIIGRRN